MTLDEYHALWEHDAQIDASEIDAEARRVPLLHAKWWRHYTTERLRFKKLEMEFNTLYHLRYEYWNGRLDDTVRKAHGWDVQPIKVLTPQLPVYLDADAVLQEVQKKLSYQTELLKFLEDCIKNINSRGYLLNTMLGYLKFKSGV